jgi:hypothetical protein
MDMPLADQQMAYPVPITLASGFSAEELCCADYI